MSTVSISNLSTNRLNSGQQRLDLNQDPFRLITMRSDLLTKNLSNEMSITISLHFLHILLENFSHYLNIMAQVVRQTLRRT